MQFDYRPNDWAFVGLIAPVLVSMPHFEHAKVGLIVEDGISSAEVGRIPISPPPTWLRF